MESWKKTDVGVFEKDIEFCENYINENLYE